MDQGSMDSHLGLGAWNTIMDRVHGPPVMDRVHMDSFFKIVINEQKQKSVTLSLQSAFYTQSAFYPWSAVCSLQSAVCVLH